jgi:hypothetical protein
MGWIVDNDLTAHKRALECDGHAAPIHLNQFAGLRD